MMTADEKLAIYEKLLHDIHFASSVTMNKERMQNILAAISRWSYSHRCGNGVLSPEDQESLIDEAFQELKNLVKT